MAVLSLDAAAQSLSLFPEGGDVGALMQGRQVWCGPWRAGPSLGGCRAHRL